MDALCALHDCALGFSPVTSYSGVKGTVACSVVVENCVRLYRGSMHDARVEALLMPGVISRKKMKRGQWPPRARDR